MSTTHHRTSPSAHRWLLAVLATLSLLAAPTAGADTAPVQEAPAPLAVDLSGHRDETTVVAPAAIRAERAEGVGPGSLLVITLPDLGARGCTANFVWRAGEQRYLGAAGHCFLPPGADTSRGRGTRYDTSGVTVRACIHNCSFGGLTGQVLRGDFVDLGTVAYARQSEDGDRLGSDFGIVEIPADVPARTGMPVFGPARYVARLSFGDPVCHYGNGAVVGETWHTMGRVGVGVFSIGDEFLFEGAAAPGDSGSAVHVCVLRDGRLTSSTAIGVLTHLTNAGVVGTTIERARYLVARDAGFSVSLQLGPG